MSRFDYLQSRDISALAPTFGALIMAAMRKADSTNSALLRQAFPEIWDELDQRYNAPGGWLPEEAGNHE